MSMVPEKSSQKGLRLLPGAAHLWTIMQTSEVPYQKLDDRGAVESCFCFNRLLFPNTIAQISKTEIEAQVICPLF